MMRTGVLCFLAMMVFVTGGPAAAQCVVGVNQSGPKYLTILPPGVGPYDHAGSASAWPYVGTAAMTPASAYLFFQGPLDFIICDGSNCQQPSLPFTEAHKSGIRAAASSWAAARTINGSNFDWREVPAKLFDHYWFVTVRRVSSASLTGAAGMVIRQWLFIHTDFDGVADGYRLVSADILLNENLTNAQAVAHTMAHEIGHTMGLDDCHTCQEGTTVMASGLYFMNDPNAPQAPSSCDNQQVRFVAFTWPNGNGCGLAYPWGC